MTATATLERPADVVSELYKRRELASERYKSLVEGLALDRPIGASEVDDIITKVGKTPDDLAADIANQRRRLELRQILAEEPAFQKRLKETERKNEQSIFDARSKVAEAKAAVAAAERHLEAVEAAAEDEESSLHADACKFLDARRELAALNAPPAAEIPADVLAKRQAEYAEREEQRAAIRDEIKELEEQIGSPHGGVQGLHGAIRDRTNAIRELQERLDAGTMDPMANAGIITRLEGELDELRERLKVSESRLAELRQAEAELSGKILAA